MLWEGITLDLILNLSQKMALSQKMLQSAEILQMSSQELENYIKELSVENPVVDFEENSEDLTKYDILKKKLEWLDASDEQNRVYYKEEKEEENSNDNWNFCKNSDENLEEYLLSQVNVLPLKKCELAIAHYIIECIDENGYLLDETCQSISKRLKVSNDIVEKMILVIQSLEPSGVGARNLKECLLLQIKRLEINNPLAETIIKNELETVGKNQLHIIAKRLKVSIDEVIAATNFIKSLNPKPGNSFYSNKALEYIRPDAVIIKGRDGFEIILNDSFLPTIKINSYYKSIVNNDSENSAKDYVCDKIRQAEWAMKCISKRNSTLTKTLEVIVEIQKDFFEYGIGNLKPMRLIDIAQKIDMHESTVSRAVRDKYLQCSWGIFALNYFFSIGISSAEDIEDKITPNTIKIKIKSIIDEENKQSPLSDREITEKLTQKGINISRRTVAKYRETMNIPGTTGRKAY